MLRKVLTLLVIFFSLAASAKDYKFVEGVNRVDAYTPANATYVPEQDGRVLVECHEVWDVKYDGNTYEHSYVPGSSYAFVYEIASVKAGTPITMSQGFPMNTQVRITLFSGGVIPVEVLNVIPAQQSKFDWNNSGMVTVGFNKVINLKSIKFVAGEYEADVDDVHFSSSLGFNITKPLNEALTIGAVNPGEKFQIIINGICDANDKANLYNGDGKYVVEYIAPSPQHKLVSAKVGDAMLSYMEANTYTFLSYYAPTADDGLFVFEFDGEVGKVGGVLLTMGALDLDSQGKYHRSQLPYTVEGNRVMVDARGTLRTLAVLFPAVVEEDVEEGEDASDVIGSFDTEHITISLVNVSDVNGNVFLSDAPGSVGSYSFVMNYQEIIDEAYIDGDNKQDGDFVAQGEEVSLWLSNANIGFDGLEVTYFVEVPAEDGFGEPSLQPRIVVVTDYKVEPDGFGGVVITFNVPQMPEVAEGSTVRVALNNATSKDGMPHYLYIEFKASASTTDCIGQVGVEKNKSARIYRLDGTETGEKPAAGLYIQGGKKIIVK